MWPSDAERSASTPADRASVPEKTSEPMRMGMER